MKIFIRVFKTREDLKDELRMDVEYLRETSFNFKVSIVEGFITIVDLNQKILYFTQDEINQNVLAGRKNFELIRNIHDVI